MLIAKSNGVTLAQHTKDVLQAALALKNKSGVDHPSALWRDLCIAAYLHDIGKADPVFQCLMRGDRKNTKISHNLLSLLLIDRTTLQDICTNPEAVLSAVAFHHWRDYYPDILLGARSENFSKTARQFLQSQEWEECIRELASEMKGVAVESQLDPNLLQPNRELAAYLMYNKLGNAKLVIPPYLLSFLPDKLVIRSISDELERIFIAGNLMRCDHFASLLETENTGLTLEDIEHNDYVNFEKLVCVLGEIFQKKGSVDRGAQVFWQAELLQKHPEYSKSSLILVAPTGTGKTEFAYLWGAGRKNLFLLPLRSAVNSMWRRTRFVFKKALPEVGERVALLHGDAAFVLENVHIDLEGESLTSLLILARHLAEPYIIATGDQIAPAVLKYPGYERLYAVLMDSCLIIDEVQAYDPRAAAIITKLLEDAHNLGGKVLLMTATLPAFIKEELQRRLNIPCVNLLRDTAYGRSLAGNSRHFLRFMCYDGDQLPEGVVSEMLAKARAGSRVLAVFNTVNKAQAVYRAAIKVKEQGDIVFLIHSRYTVAHRREKENSVEKLMPNNTIINQECGCLVIATQIVEASLDIDADYLYTELSPMDSLVQRLGRHKRKYARCKISDVSDAPDVFLLVSRERLVSGCGTVYDSHLVALTGLLLALHARGELFEESSSILNRYLGLCYEDCGSKRGRRKSKNKEKDFFAGLCELLRDSPPFRLTEAQKQDFVDMTYAVLTEARKVNQDVAAYLNSFYETLSILDSGYCSDRKFDAQRLFRNVQTVEILPAEKEEEFWNAVVLYFQTTENPSFLSFKQEVLSHFIVPIDWRLLKEKGRVLGASIPEVVGHISGRIGQLQRWLEGITVHSFSYDSDIGLILEKENGECDV